MSPIYLGLVGPIASGKGVLADHLKGLGFDYYSLSDQVRQEAVRRNLPINRETLQNLGDEMRKVHGPCILAERALLSVTNPNRCLVFDSLRNPSEINLFRHLIDIKIIGVDAPVENRLHWYLKRSKEIGEDDPDMSAFIKVSLRDRGIDQESYGQQVDKCLAIADIVLNNGGTKDDILKSLDLFLLNEFRFDTEIYRRFVEK